ncbi:MAG TPA: EscU/YscU/HrcU family type III secretion system export apparatus switch protein [Polyangiaceae bacterium]|nr:EscU/YscU/HrcU family type III secretion system export apparatus switch protein [Polyangiaceae bacterium]
MAEKTEEPTPRRLRRARAEGDGPLSAAFGQSFALLVAVLLVPGTLAATSARAASLLRTTLGSGLPGAGSAASTLATEVISLSAPLLLAVAGTAVALGWVQTGGVVSFGKLAPRLERLDPVQGLKNLFRRERWFALARALVGAGLAGFVTVSVLRNHAADVATAAGNELAVGPLVAALGKQLGVLVALAGVGLALVDLVITHQSFRARHRMSKDEIRREFREAEGDPEIRAKRRRAHQEALAGSIVNAVREATVVIVNPTHLASALRYVEELDEAPKVVAQGEGELARAIVAAAHAYGIPCIQDVPIARALRELELGDEIPEALYEAVAEILRTVTEGRQASG